MNLHPLRPWHIASLFAGQLQAGFLANAQHLANVVNRLNPSCIAILIEEGVTRYFDRINQPNCAVPGMFPALEVVVAITHATAAVETRVCENFRATQIRPAP